MPEFNTSLLREKFIINDLLPVEGSAGENVIALSNRLVLPLQNDDDTEAETFVIRAQTMHLCTRMGAYLAREFQEHGPILTREDPVDFENAYQMIVKGYEEDWNPDHWVTIYHRGQTVFEAGPADRHPFLDIIEHCDARNKGDYEKALSVAQEAFSQAGRIVRIDYDSNIALVVNIKPEEGKCGLILRGPIRTTTFNMIARKRPGHLVRPSHCLSAAAAYLEGIQLAFRVGMTRQKLRYELIASGSPEARQGDEASSRIGRLNAAIRQFEEMFNVSYRPEKPNFSDLVIDAERFARKVLASEIEERIMSGAEDADQWVL